jgi:hypothetical protein
MAYAKFNEGIRKEFYQQMKNANSKQRRDLIREPRIHICLKRHLRDIDCDSVIFNRARKIEYNTDN